MLNLIQAKMKKEPFATRNKITSFKSHTLYIYEFIGFWLEEVTVIITFIDDFHKIHICLLDGECIEALESSNAIKSNPEKGKENKIKCFP